MMARLEPWILAYLLNSLWQIPLVFTAALIAARIARPAGPRMEHRVWASALLLEAVLPLCNVHLTDLWQRAWGLALWLRAAGGADGETRVLVSGGSPHDVPVPWLSTNLLASLAIAYIAMALYFAGRLLWGVWITESMRRRAVAVDLPEDVRRNLQRFERIIAKRIPEGSIEIASSAAISGPAAVGVRRHTLLLPHGFLSHLSQNEVDAVLAHEIAHMERGDYLEEPALRHLVGAHSLPSAGRAHARTACRIARDGLRFDCRRSHRRPRHLCTFPAAPRVVAVGPRDAPRPSRHRNLRCQHL